jgi:hypothetical protein
MLPPLSYLPPQEVIKELNTKFGTWQTGDHQSFSKTNGAIDLKYNAAASLPIAYASLGSLPA